MGIYSMLRSLNLVYWRRAKLLSVLVFLLSLPLSCLILSLLISHKRGEDEWLQCGKLNSRMFPGLWGPRLLSLRGAFFPKLHQRTCHFWRGTRWSKLYQSKCRGLERRACYLVQTYCYSLAGMISVWETCVYESFVVELYFFYTSCYRAGCCFSPLRRKLAVDIEFVRNCITIVNVIQANVLFPRFCNATTLRKQWLGLFGGSNCAARGKIWVSDHPGWTKCRISLISWW